jgi:phosphatidylserine decarboxylase
MLGNLLKILPRNWLSFLVGKLVSLKLPPPFAAGSIKAFGDFYKINFDEAEKPLSEYRSIGEFFTRRLKPGARPIAGSPLVHPADSRIAQVGLIENGHCIQAKGRSYSVADLLQNDALSSQFHGGLYVTYYLCPTDYHRVHSPVDGVVRRSIHVPGTLWPVNDWSMNAIDDLYPRNERLVVEMESRLGKIAVVFVGATNVGKITTSFDPEISTNDLQTKKIVIRDYAQAVAIEKGEELGTFHMGSTVVLLFPATIAKQRDDWYKLLDLKVKMGESLL